MPIDLNIGSLEKAIVSLQAAIARRNRTPEDDMVRDACIQRFEVTYELSRETLKRFREATSANPEAIDHLSFRDLIRSGSERGMLLSDWSRWKAYRTARSATSHAHDETKAREAFSIIPEFLRESIQALSESDLPFRADVLDCRSVEPSFREAIDRDGIEFG